MDELFRTSPEIIKAAATSPLALAALIVMTLGVISFIHFRSASEVTRVAVFVLTGLAVLIVFGIALVMALIRDEFPDSRAETLVPPPHINIDPTPAPLPEPVAVPPEENQLASTCVTDSLSCPLVFPAQLPIGSNCSCYTLFGQEYPGTAQ